MVISLHSHTEFSSISSNISGILNPKRGSKRWKSFLRAYLKLMIFHWCPAFHPMYSISNEIFWIPRAVLCTLESSIELRITIWIYQKVIGPWEKIFSVKWLIMVNSLEKVWRRCKLSLSLSGGKKTFYVSMKF